MRKCTGSLGGNGSGGPIYGELTSGSMQKVVALMVSKGGLNENSVFVDVGAGLGKPNMHVGLQPKVKYSVGVEIERVRWFLSLVNLNAVLVENDGSHSGSWDSSSESGSGSVGTSPEVDLASGSSPSLPAPLNVAFLHRDCFGAKSFDPFTHVYIFDIGMVILCVSLSLCLLLQKCFCFFKLCTLPHMLGG